MVYLLQVGGWGSTSHFLEQGQSDWPRPWQNKGALDDRLPERDADAYHRQLHQKLRPVSGHAAVEKELRALPEGPNRL